jgi:hypothetical protein
VRAPEYVRLERRIENVLENAPRAPEEVRSDLLKLAAVLSAGYVELACQEIFGRYSAARASEEVGSFVAGQLKRFQNMTPTRVCDLASMFSPAGGEAVRAHMEDRIEASLESLVTLRNNIAHGRDMAVGHAILRQYFADVSRLVRFLQERFPGKK